MANAALFWDKIASKYAQTPIRDQQGYQETLDRTRSHLKPTDRVLEIGCGTGSTALELSAHVAHITATDVSSQMIRIANEKREKSGVSNVVFDVAFAEDETAPAGPFDAVLAHNLLHLVDDVPRCLGQVRARLKDNGLFVSKSACLADANLLLRLAVPVMTLIGKAPKVSSFSVDQLDQMIDDAGFDRIEILSQNGIVPVRYIVARKL